MRRVRMLSGLATAGLGAALLWTTGGGGEAADAEAAAAAPTAAGGAGPGDELRLVQVVFRHGARSPLAKRYWPELGVKWDVCGEPPFAPAAVEVSTEAGAPRPPNPDDLRQVEEVLPGGCSRGQLTLLGHQQALGLGEWLRQRYVVDLRLLPHALHAAPGAGVAAAVHGRTTNYSRTLATLRGVLAGLYPKAQLPVHVTTTEELDEILFTNPKSCGRLREMVQGLHATHRRGADAAPPPGVAAVDAAVRGALKLEPDHRISYTDLHDVLTTMKAHGKEIPPALRDPGLQAAVERQATERFLNLVAPSASTGVKEEVLRLGLGRLMALLTARMDAAAAAGSSTSGSSPSADAEAAAAAGAAGADSAVRLYLYSGHDSTIMPLLAMLGKEVDHWPPYVSNFVFELWRRPGGEHYVQVLYNRQELPLHELCGAATCPLEAFRATAVGPYLLSEAQYNEECSLDSAESFKMHFKHDAPAGEHVRVIPVQQQPEKEVSIGSSMDDD